MYQQMPPFGGGFGFRPQHPMQGYYQQPQQPAPMPTGVMMVTDRQQAEVAAIPFDGSAAYFHNTATDDLYVKRFDLSTGKSPLTVYRRVMETDDRPVYATVAALEELGQRVAALEGAGRDEYQPRRAREGSE